MLIDLLNAMNSKEESLEAARYLNLDDVTPVRDEISTPATNNSNVREKEVTLAEECLPPNLKTSQVQGYEISININGRAFFQCCRRHLCRQ